jgi:hypothetical protein
MGKSKSVWSMRKNETMNNEWIRQCSVEYDTIIVVASRRPPTHLPTAVREEDAAEAVETSVVAFTKGIPSLPSPRNLFLQPTRQLWTPLIPSRNHSLRDDSGMHQGLIAFMDRMANAKGKFAKDADTIHLQTNQGMTDPDADIATIPILSPLLNIGVMSGLAVQTQLA